MGGRVISGRVLTAFSHRPLDGPCGTRSCATHALTLSREGKSLSLSPQTRAYQIRIFTGAVANVLGAVIFVSCVFVGCIIVQLLS